MKPRVLVKYQLVWIGYLVKIDIIYLVFITGTTGKILCNCFDRIISVSWGRNPTFSMQAGNARKKKTHDNHVFIFKKKQWNAFCWESSWMHFFSPFVVKSTENLYIINAACKPSIQKKVSENDFCFPVTNVVMDSRPKKFDLMLGQ